MRENLDKICIKKLRTCIILIVVTLSSMQSNSIERLELIKHNQTVNRNWILTKSKIDFHFVYKPSIKTMKDTCFTPSTFMKFSLS